MDAGQAPMSKRIINHCVELVKRITSHSLWGYRHVAREGIAGVEGYFDPAGLGNSRYTVSSVYEPYGLCVAVAGVVYRASSPACLVEDCPDQTDLDLYYGVVGAPAGGDGEAASRPKGIGSWIQASMVIIVAENKIDMPEKFTESFRHYCLLVCLRVGCGCVRVSVGQQEKC